MKVACPTCSSNLNIDDTKIPPGGARIKCPTCKNIFPVKPGGGGGPEAVPLPGASAPTSPVPAAPRASGAVPLPGLSAAKPQSMVETEEKTRVGDANPGELAFDDSTNTAPPPARSGAVPLPGARGQVAVAAPIGIPPSLQRTQAGGPSAVPLPGARGKAASAAGGAISLGGPPEATNTNPSPDFGSDDLPSPAPASGSMDFALDDAPPPPMAKARGAEAPDYSDLPSPSLGDNLPSPSLGDNLPTPSLGDLPMPSTPGLPEPAAAPRNVGFGEVDLGGGDSLEFDPTAAKKDDLEADLSAPLPPPKATGPADGMEMLNFIDQQAKAANIKDGPKARRFHIKRRSGKVFGPFDEAVVVKMLEDGQLLGNEEVSLDAESWTPIGAEAGFQTAIANLMASPSKSMATAMPGADDGSGAGGQQSASMDRLKQLYEGRMAAVAVVESRAPIPLAARIPLILLAVAVIGALGTGLFLGTTPYGFFGLKKIFPARISAGSREAQQLAEARAAMLRDTWKSYQEARDATLATLKVKEYPEARALWCQSIFHLKRRYGAAKAEELTQANAELENIELLGKKHVEVVKAGAGAALARGDAGGALTLLNDALARSENQADLELYFLRAEALALNKQLPQAMADLKTALEKDPRSSRALHAMGELHLQLKEVDLALGRFAEALKVDPGHVFSGVETAAITLHERRDAEKAQKVLDAVLSDEERGKLAPSELGRALAYKGEVLALKYKYKEAIPVFEEALKADPGGARARYAYGRSLLAVNDVDKALPLLKGAYEADPRNIDYVDAYLASLIERGMMDDATRVIGEANKAFPGNAKLAYLTARVDDALDRGKDAEQNYLRAVSADGSLVDANLYLARFYLRFRRFKEARPQLVAAVAKAPDNAHVHLGLGELSLAEKDTEAAEKAFRKVTQLDPNLAEGYMGQSQVALAQDKLESAAALADKALQLNPRVRGGRLQRGATLWKLGKLDEAQKELEQGRQDDPRSIAIPTTLGAVLLDKGDLNGAIAALTAAVQREPNNAEANFYLARVKNRKLEHSQAIELMKKALDAAGKRAEYNYWMGRIYLDARKIEEAREQWKQALQIDPKHADSLEALGRWHLDRNQVKQSVQFFERALDVEPTRFVVMAAIGDAYMKAERYDDAIKSYLKALERAPDLPGVHSKLAEAYFDRRKYSEAIDWYKKATVKEPENATSYLNLGWCYKEKKMNSQAVAAFKQYLAKRPDAENKQEIQDQIDYLSGD
jgi:cellulose synthase operon protein C